MKYGSIKLDKCKLIELPIKTAYLPVDISNVVPVFDPYFFSILIIRSFLYLF